MRGTCCRRKPVPATGLDISSYSARFAGALFLEMPVLYPFLRTYAKGWDTSSSSRAGFIQAKILDYARSGRT
jgi:hypothetical protein